MEQYFEKTMGPRGSAFFGFDWEFALIDSLATPTSDTSWRKVQLPHDWSTDYPVESPFNDGTLAWHNAEIPYVFHNAEYLEPSFIPGVTEGLQDLMSGAWASFAETGDPNHTGHPVWPQVTLDQCPTMIYGTDSGARTDHDAAFLDVAPKEMVLPVFMKKKKEQTPSLGPQSK